jgi:hypothetical protein
MSLDLANFHKVNVVDSCSAWNMLSSKLLWARALQASCYFSCTHFVIYECLYKQRTRSSPADDEIQQRMKSEIKASRIAFGHLDLEDLQDVEVLATRRNLSKGELSAIAFARRTNQAVLTDDQKARRLAETALPSNRVQTVPHLAGWLLYQGYLSESEYDVLIQEHEALGRPLKPHLQKARFLCLEARLAAQYGASTGL